MHDQEFFMLKIGQVPEPLVVFQALTKLCCFFNILASEKLMSSDQKNTHFYLNPMTIIIVITQQIRLFFKF